MNQLSADVIYGWCMRRQSPLDSLSVSLVENQVAAGGRESIDHIRGTDVTTMLVQKWIILSAVFLLISAGRGSCRDRFTLREGFGIRVPIGDSQLGIKFGYSYSCPLELLSIQIGISDSNWVLRLFICIGVVFGCSIVCGCIRGFCEACEADSNEYPSDNDLQDI